MISINDIDLMFDPNMGVDGETNFFPLEIESILPHQTPKIL